MSIAICSVPVAPLRKNPSHESEMVSQVLFGERVEVIKQEGQWFQVICQFDQYQGWISSNQIEILQTNNIPTDDFLIFNSNLVNILESNKGSFILPMGAQLPYYSGGKGSLGDLVYSYSGADAKLFGDQKADPVFLESILENWVNAPYLWGGRTLMGVDCSGFTQMIYKMMGIALLRDAYQQATQGETVDFLQSAKLGDLAFFDNAEGKIFHVGILLNPQQIIHASGKVRIDTIDNAGILQDGKHRTHYLRIIKRYF